MVHGKRAIAEMSGLGPKPWGLGPQVLGARVRGMKLVETTETKPECFHPLRLLKPSNMPRKVGG